MDHNGSKLRDYLSTDFKHVPGVLSHWALVIGHMQADLDAVGLDEPEIEEFRPEAHLTEADRPGERVERAAIPPAIVPADSIQAVATRELAQWDGFKSLSPEEQTARINQKARRIALFRSTMGTLVSQMCEQTKSLRSTLRQFATEFPDSESTRLQALKAFRASGLDPASFPDENDSYSYWLTDAFERIPGVAQHWFAMLEYLIGELDQFSE